MVGAQLLKLGTHLFIAPSIANGTVCLVHRVVDLLRGELGYSVIALGLLSR